MAVVPFWDKLSAETTLVRSRSLVLQPPQLPHLLPHIIYLQGEHLKVPSEVDLSRLVPPFSSNAIVFSRIHSVRSRRMNFVRLVSSDSRHGSSKASFPPPSSIPNCNVLRSLDSQTPLLSWRRIAHISSLSPQRFSLIRRGPGLMLQETSPEHDCTWSPDSAQDVTVEN